MEELVQQAVVFHGHLGPFLIVGLKMGTIALERFGLKKYTSLKVAVESSKKPPLSCMIDGIQVATGCTLGRGTIEIKQQGIPRAHFEYQAKKITIKLKEEYYKKIIQQLKKDTPEVVAETLLKQIKDSYYLIIEHEG
jgi:pyrimidine-specific ribonucleoside hydrolase